MSAVRRFDHQRLAAALSRPPAELGREGQARRKGRVAVEALLLELCARFKQLEERVAAMPAAVAEAVGQDRGRARRLKPGDRKALAQLLPAIWAALKNRVFAVRDLTEHCVQIQKVAERPGQAEIPLEVTRAAAALRAALDAIGDPRKVGRLLSRGHGFEIGDFRVSAGSERLTPREFSVSIKLEKTPPA